MSRARRGAPTRVRGRREHRKQATRRLLLAAGRRLFGREGLYDSRIEDLTKLAGIAKGTLYGYFSSREELIQAVVAQGYGELLQHVRVRVRAARTERARMAGVVRAHLEFFERNPDLLRLFHQVRGLLKFDRRRWRPQRGILVDYLDQLAAALAGGAGGTGLRHAAAGPRRDLAQVLFGAVSGVASARAALVSARPTVAEAARIREALVELGLAYRSRARDRARRRGGRS